MAYRILADVVMLLHFTFIVYVVIGGYTTFSAYTVETMALLDGGHTRLGLAYLGATLVCAVTAVDAGVFLTRWATASHRSTDRRRP